MFKYSMQTIRARLSLNYLLVLALGMTLAGALAWLAVERLYINTQRENLLAQAHLIATALQGSVLPAQPVQPYSQAANVTPGVHTRLLSDSGAVIGDFRSRRRSRKRPLQNSTQRSQLPS